MISSLPVSSGRTSKIISIFFLSLVLITFLVLVFLFHRRKQQRKAQESSPLDIVPLVRPGTSEKNTDVHVSDLLTFLTKMLKLEHEGEDDDSDDEKSVGLVKEYRSLSSHSLYPCTVAKDPNNITKNRFLNVLPYNHSRVVLKSRKHKDDGFINASYIDGYKKSNYYIATQGPLLHTIVDFWEMIWQENSTVIVMLTNLIEQDKPKCEQYWPEDLQSQEYGEFTVTSTKRESQTSKSFIVRNLQLIKVSGRTADFTAQPPS
ncbi:receptor-type tyrosine-protein phosphatase alpha-like [Carcharodon carcharias]|uniref:receptor-type tyrosine-protein phosphatase alpha-like n=1 Tax=Carcharodon carcharias TaxID=13397 RepID=UPI001B7F1DB3|nr:receptor-type tyrosine-protein phosphatase alpha-like [Carcharodon carcharias]